MPVTPRFVLHQDDDFVYVDIRTPYVRVADLEYTIDGPAVSFYVKPYLLKLNLPGAVEDNDRTKAEYDPIKDNGTVTLHLPKREKGKHFEDLDLLTKLRQPAKARAVKLDSAATPKSETARAPEQPLQRDAPGATGPLIQVLSSLNFDDTPSAEENGDDQQTTSEDAKQKIPTNSSTNEEAQQGQSSASEEYLASLLEKATLEESNGGGKQTSQAPSYEEDAAHYIEVDFEKPKYGFNHGFDGFFNDILTEFPELVDLPDPDNALEPVRREKRVEAENEAFHVERYLADLEGASEDHIFEAALNYKLPEDFGTSEFTVEEQEQMLKLRNREFLPFSKFEQERALCSILDITLGYLYDMRTTQGEHNVESAWTIRILSPTLSWLEGSADLGETVRSNVLRSIIYPYLRHLSLARKVLLDAVEVLKQGKRGLVRCILDVHRIFARSDIFYLHNRLYITDMAVWIQQVETSVMEEFCQRAIACASFYARDPYEALRWDLRQLEADFGVNQESSDDDDSDSDDSDSSSDDTESSSEEERDGSESESDTEEEDEKDAAAKKSTEEVLEVLAEKSNEEEIITVEPKASDTTPPPAPKLKLIEVLEETTIEESDDLEKEQ